MGFTALRENLARVEQEIAAVRDREGVRDEVRIVAVTKGHCPNAVRAALDAGLRDVGENRVQEAVQKQESLGDLPVDWHLIGHLQTNKAKLVPGRFVMVHSVDSERVVDALDRAMDVQGVSGPVAVLIQVNVAGEGQKSGCRADEVLPLAARIGERARIELRGLMTMAPFTSDQTVQRETFRSLRLLRERLEADGISAPELSMGMSNDYSAAVAEGATILRLGTALFGQRAA